MPLIKWYNVGTTYGRPSFIYTLFYFPFISSFFGFFVDIQHRFLLSKIAWNSCLVFLFFFYNTVYHFIKYWLLILIFSLKRNSEGDIFFKTNGYVCYHIHMKSVCLCRNWHIDRAIIFLSYNRYFVQFFALFTDNFEIIINNAFLFARRWKKSKQTKLTQFMLTIWRKNKTIVLQLDLFHTCTHFYITFWINFSACSI